MGFTQYSQNSIIFLIRIKFIFLWFQIWSKGEWCSNLCSYLFQLPQWSSPTICLITMSSSTNMLMWLKQNSVISCIIYLVQWHYHPLVSPSKSLTVFLSHFHSFFNQSQECIVSTFEFQTSDHLSQSGLKSCPQITSHHFLFSRSFKLQKIMLLERMLIC